MVWVFDFSGAKRDGACLIHLLLISLGRAQRPTGWGLVPVCVFRPKGDSRLEHDPRNLGVASRDPTGQVRLVIWIMIIIHKPLIG